MKTYTRGIRTKGATILKNSEAITITEVLCDLSAVHLYKYPIGAVIYHPHDPDLHGEVIGQMYQAPDETLKLPEGKMYMIKTGAVSELEFIFEKDAELFAEQEKEAVA